MRGGTLLTRDVNGDKLTDFAIQVDGAGPVVLTDIV